MVDGWSCKRLDGMLTFLLLVQRDVWRDLCLLAPPVLLTPVILDWDVGGEPGLLGAPA